MTLPSKGYFSVCFGLAEEIPCLMLHNTPHWILTQRIDHALLLWGSSFTVGTADEGPHNATVPTKLESSASMATTPRPRHVMAATPESSHVRAAQPMFLSVVAPMTIKPEPCHNF